MERSRIAGVLLVAGVASFWASWALMPLPGSTDAAAILEAVGQARPRVWLSCILQLASAAAWVIGLVLLPPNGQRAWWAGVAALAAGMTGSAADAIYHLAAFELTAPGVPADVALPIMTRLQGPDLALLAPTAAAGALGILLLVVAAVRARLLPRAALGLFGAAALAGAMRVAAPGIAREAALVALACGAAPIAWLGVAVSAGRRS